MKPGPGLALLLRMAAALLVVAALLVKGPALWLRPAAALGARLVEWTAPAFTSVSTQVERTQISVEGTVRLPMTRAGGEALPDLPGRWRTYGGRTLHVLLVAAALWAAPAVGRRRRALALPVMLAGALLVSGYDLATDMQATALRVIGREWLPQVQMEDTEANREAFRRLEARYLMTLRLKAFNDGGGRLFFAVIVGLLGYTLPGKKDQTPAR